MSSFSANSRFRIGYWKAFRSFVLNSRRDLASRVSAINAELLRIGFVYVTYAVDPGTGKPTERRLAVDVLPRGSTMESLMRAYVAMGGNPLDISHFMLPGKAMSVPNDEGGEDIVDVYPYGGIIAPRTSGYEEPVGSWGEYPGGWLMVAKYVPARIGGRKDMGDEARALAGSMLRMREAITQEVRWRRLDLEQRILRQCDLYEQLDNERGDILLRLWGDYAAGMVGVSAEAFDPDVMIQAIVTKIDDSIFEDGSDDEFKPSLQKMSGRDTIYLDVESEAPLTSNS